MSRRQAKEKKIPARSLKERAEIIFYFLKRFLKNDRDQARRSGVTLLAGRPSIVAAT